MKVGLRMTECEDGLSSVCPPGEPGSDVGTQAGVHRLVESLYGLQGERSKLRGELRLLHSQLEQKERDRHSRIQAFQQQVRTRLQLSSTPSDVSGKLEKCIIVTINISNYFRMADMFISCFLILCLLVWREESFILSI